MLEGPATNSKRKVNTKMKTMDLVASYRENKALENFSEENSHIIHGIDYWGENYSFICNDNKEEKVVKDFLKENNLEGKIVSSESHLFCEECYRVLRDDDNVSVITEYNVLCITCYNMNQLNKGEWIKGPNGIHIRKLGEDYEILEVFTTQKNKEYFNSNFVDNMYNIRRLVASLNNIPKDEQARTSLRHKIDGKPDAEVMREWGMTSDALIILKSDTIAGEVLFENGIDGKRLKIELANLYK